MKMLNEEIKRIAESVMKTSMSSSSLEEKTAEYFRSNQGDVLIFKSNTSYIQSLLKKGDELIHTIYAYCYKNNDKNNYINQYSSFSLEKVGDTDFKTVKKIFKNDEDNSGIFNYKVFCVSNDIFTDTSIENESSNVELIGDEY